MEDLVATQQERLDSRVQRSGQEDLKLSCKAPLACGCDPQWERLRRVQGLCNEKHRQSAELVEDVRR